jgi:hypothetical protein
LSATGFAGQAALAFLTVLMTGDIQLNGVKTASSTARIRLQQSGPLVPDSHTPSDRPEGLAQLGRVFDRSLDYE